MLTDENPVNHRGVSLLKLVLIGIGNIPVITGC